MQKNKSDKKIFYRAILNQWLPIYPTTLKKQGKSNKLYLPIIIDTEFQTFSPYDVYQNLGVSSIPLTIQSKLWLKENSKKIWLHPQCPNQLINLSKIQHDFIGFDILEDSGFKIDYYPELLDTVEFKIHFLFYAHFALAELCKIAQNSFLNYIIDKCSCRNGQRIEQKRRILCVADTRTKKSMPCYLDLPGTLYIDGVPCDISMQFLDTIGLVGNASYANLAKITNVKLKYKDNFTSEEKGKMAQMIETRFEDFCDYALGDLQLDEILINFDNIMRNVCSDVAGFTPKPGYIKPTIGATVAQLTFDWIKPYLTEGINQLNSKERFFWETEILNLKEKEQLNEERVWNEVNKRINALYLKNQIESGLATACKVDGGRCRNNTPLRISVDSVIYDIDISGCYANAMMSLHLPIGKPFAIGRKRGEKGAITLKEFLKQLRKDLVPGLWQLRISTSEPLSFDQDLLISWIPPKQIERIFKDDFEHEELYDLANIAESAAPDDTYNVDANKGTSCILYREVKHGILTSDLLEIIENVWNTKERKEFFEKAVIENALLFPIAERVNTVSELLKEFASQDKRKRNKIKVGRTKRKNLYEFREYQELHWTSIPISNLITKYATLRSQAKRQFGNKSPQQNAYKLTSNTTYGVMVSPYFHIGNVILANNITARARSMAYLMEKALYGFQTITDGCSFDLNRVVGRVKGRRLSSQSLVDLSRIDGNQHVNSKKTLLRHARNLTWQTLNNEKAPYRLEYSETNDYAIYKKLVGKFPPSDQNKPYQYPVLVSGCGVDEAENEGFTGIQKYIDISAINHIYDFYHDCSNITILKEKTFELEGKYIFHKGIFHGSSNYLLVSDVDNQSVLKCRGYESKKDHYGQKDSDKLDIVISPSIEFFNMLNENPEYINFPRVKIKNMILKLGEFRNRNYRYRESEIKPGDNVYKIQLFRAFNYNAFTYNTWQQRKKWKSYIDRLNKHLGITMEIVYRQNGNIRFHDMIRQIYLAILNNEKPKIFESIDSRHLKRDWNEHHETSLKKKLETEFNNLYNLKSKKK